MLKIALEYGTTPGWVYLRETRGHDEESIDETDSQAAIALVDRLLVALPGAVLGPGQAVELAVPDRDRLLAAVCQALFGPRIESTVRCQSCDKSFDLDFVLADLVASLSEPAGAGVVREPQGVFRMADGRRFLLPRGLDERAVAGESPEKAERSLLGRCLIEGSADSDPGAVAEAMRRAGPLLHLEIEAHCPECATTQQVQFDLQHYLLARLRDERRARALEIHRIALAYRWSLAEILDLPRQRRRLHVELIERDTLVR
jgi:hypothetical protein